MQCVEFPVSSLTFELSLTIYSLNKVSSMSILSDRGSNSKSSIVISENLRELVENLGVDGLVDLLISHFESSTLDHSINLIHFYLLNIYPCSLFL